MFVIDKFTKRITLISEKNTFKTKNWALLLLKRLNIVDWRYSKIIIIDRNRKFLSKLWRIIFERLNVSLLYFTFYHSQTDDASERINQIAKIALRFFIHELQNASIWSHVLSRFQTLNNNANSSTTRKTSNEIAYDFIFNRSLNLLSNMNLDMLNQSHIRIQTRDVIFWVNMKYKHHYDRRHTSLFFKKNDWALIKLHKNYSISSTIKIIKKLTQQYVKSFKIIQRIDRLAYRLDIFEDWKIHSVFSVAQLEFSSSSDFDSYSRSRSTNSFFVFVEDDINESKSYEINRLLNKRMIKRDREQSTEYLIK